MRKHNPHIEGMAMALWADACSTACEDIQCSLRGEITEQVGKPPTLAYQLAYRLCGAIEQANGTSCEVLMYRAAKAMNLPCLSPDVEETWGHYAAMQSMGHGVSWEDSHPAYEYKNTHYAEGIAHALDGCAHRWALRHKRKS